MKARSDGEPWRVVRVFIHPPRSLPSLPSNGRQHSEISPKRLLPRVGIMGLANQPCAPYSACGVEFKSSTRAHTIRLGCKRSPVQIRPSRLCPKIFGKHILGVPVVRLHKATGKSVFVSRAAFARMRPLPAEFRRIPLHRARGGQQRNSGEFRYLHRARGVAVHYI